MKKKNHRRISVANNCRNKENSPFLANTSVDEGIRDNGLRPTQKMYHTDSFCSLADPAQVHLRPKLGIPCWLLWQNSLEDVRASAEMLLPGELQERYCSHRSCFWFPNIHYGILSLHSIFQQAVLSNSLCIWPSKNSSNQPTNPQHVLISLIQQRDGLGFLWIFHKNESFYRWEIEAGQRDRWAKRHPPRSSPKLLSWKRILSLPTWNDSPFQTILHVQRG